ncbi:MAG TPA: hypothetical protein VNT27_16805 [Propionibacteriaceae bacterium]|nr:hypothetical protein [Propionibacteriaceae bacterium]
MPPSTPGKDGGRRQLRPTLGDVGRCGERVGGTRDGGDDEVGAVR